MNKYTKV